ncbi:MAG TPA: 2Fe-2S iron-sulfur cluster-binding protein, partial [bacterium]
MPEHKILFLPSKKSAYFEAGTNFRDAALELGIVIESTCAGIGTCAKCKVNIQEGAAPPTGGEKELLTPKELAKGIRLSCQARIESDGVCVVPQESQLFGDQIVTEGSKGHYQLAPDLRKVVVNVPPAELGQKYFDFEQFMTQLRDKAVAVADYDFHVVREMVELLRQNNYQVTAVVDQNRLLTVEAGDTTPTLLGVAVDIGTTTVAAKLLNLVSGEVTAVASAVNPQKAYGADVVARINYTVEHKGGLELLHRLIVKQINELIAQLCSRVGIQADNIYKLAVAGNTVMQHLFLK